MNIEKFTRSSKVQKKMDDFCKNNNETNKEEQNISLDPQKNLCMERSSKQNSD